MASLLVSFYSIQALGPAAIDSLQGCVQTFFGLAGTAEVFQLSDLRGYFTSACITFLTAAMPVALICILVAVVLTLAQTKLLVSFKSIKFKASRISPLAGFKRMFSMRAVVELFKAIIKIVMLGYIVYTVFIQYVPEFPSMMDMSVSAAVGKTGEAILSIVQSVAIASAFVAGFDYIYQWWEYEKNLRMSKQEIKEEYKQSEGDPQIKAKIKERQQAAARRRMMQSVPSADVVIRNPTHYAVAVKYSPESHGAPVVVAKGMDSLALRIVDVAEKNNVAVMENRPLARGLYEAVDIDREIPEKFYQAVAEVLAFVFSVKKKDLK